MRIALINENSQAAKNEIVYNVLLNSVKPLGHEAVNYGMLSGDDDALTYVQNGLLASILLNSKAADFVVTGCGTGEGALIALNAFPGVQCGLIIDPSDAFLFSQINNGNAVSLPYAKGFGWGADLNLNYIFHNLFAHEGGQGYPKERAEIMAKNRNILTNIKKITHKPLIDILKEIDQEFLFNTINRKSFKQYFFNHAKDQEIMDYCRKILNL